VQVEIAELVLQYAGLRVQDRRRQARLSASLAEHGQQSPVLVVEAAGAGRPQLVLIDGYLRVEALRQLARDVVDALRLDLSEVDALLLRHRLETGRRRSALEDAWLLHELQVRHGLRQQQLGERLDRSSSWISRHLALVRVLPEPVQRAVQLAVLPPQAASKYLVPLARANPEACAQLVTALGTTRVSVRQVEHLYVGWREGDVAQRQRLLSDPHLYLKALEVVPAAEPSSGPNGPSLLLAELERMAGCCRRARARLREHALEQASPRRRHGILRAWREASLSFTALAEIMTTEESDVGSGHEDGDPATRGAGPGRAEDCSGALDLAQCGAAGAAQRTG
jgi:ParB/RepB/Spo0J family partition protein